ncbi:MAG: trypsin-like peptidase domain-containing protein [Lachnospiraceae bacterium]|nr:trypsin-like peptidase domain-containing protein [Lachnospiraceae bacterium]
MIYDDQNKKNENTENTGYVNVGSSGTNSANKYNEAESGQTGGYNYNSSYKGAQSASQGRPHYTSYQDANYREPMGSGNTSQPKKKAPSSGKKGGFWKKAVAAVVAGVLLGGSAAGTFYGVYRLTDMDDAVATIAESKAVAEEASRTANTIAKESKDVQSTSSVSSEAQTGVSGVSKVVAETMPSLVAITNAVTMTGQTWWGQTVERTGESAGSGIIVGENDDELLIVTNQHVISDATKLSVQFVDGNSAEANLKGQDEDADIAVIAVKKSDLGDTADKIKIAKLGDSDALQVGEQVIAIGNAMGYGQTTTTGIVSALGIERDFSNGMHKLIQTDAAINPGNSGGALLNMNGELIGINEAKAGHVLSTGMIVEGMGYAIPISTVQPIIDEMMSKETKEKTTEENQSFLGIGGVDVTEEVSKTYDIPEGIYIAQVDPESAAAKAGLVRGDVIIKFDGQAVDSMEDLKELMQYYPAGTTVDITIKTESDDGYTEKEVSVTLGKRPLETAQ